MINNSIRLKIAQFVYSLEITAKPQYSESGEFLGYKVRTNPNFNWAVASPIPPNAWQISALRQAIIKQLEEDAANGKPLPF